MPRNPRGSRKPPELSGDRFERLNRSFRRKYAHDKKVLADANELVDAMQMWTIHVWLSCMKHARRKP